MLLCRVAFFQEVYELVRGLPYLWAACVLSAWLRKQSSHFPCRQDDRVDHALTGKKSEDFPEYSCPIPSDRPLPVLSVFLWEARLAYVSQRVLRGPSAAVCPAPSLLQRSVDEYTEALTQISVSLALVPARWSAHKGFSANPGTRWSATFQEKTSLVWLLKGGRMPSASVFCTCGLCAGRD